MPEPKGSGIALVRAGSAGEEQLWRGGEMQSPVLDAKVEDAGQASK